MSVCVCACVIMGKREHVGHMIENDVAMTVAEEEDCLPVPAVVSSWYKRKDTTLKKSKRDLD